MTSNDQPEMRYDITAYDHATRSLIRLDLAEIIAMRPAT